MGTRIEVSVPDESVPLSVTRAGYNPEREAAKYEMNKKLIATKYCYEKVIGDRTEHGCLKMQELKPEQKQYIACFISGMKCVEIAEQFDVSAAQVYRVVGDPLARQMIEEFDEGYKAEFMAMFPLVSDAVREALESGDAALRLKAVDRWAKIRRLLDGGDEGDGGNRVEQIFSARARFVTMVQDVVGSQKQLLEVEAEMVEVKS